MEEKIDINNGINSNDSEETDKTLNSFDQKNEDSTKAKDNPNPIKVDTLKEGVNKEIVSKVIKKETSQLNKTEPKPKKEPPIEKKPFEVFVNTHSIPSLIEKFKQRGFDTEEINLKNTLRPISEDKCWVIYCKVKDTCNFWLSFEKDDISSPKSISLSKPNQKPSIIESFLIDEKRITLDLIISRVLQRLNGQKIIGLN